MARRSLSASYGPRNRTVSQSRTIFILSSRRCSSFHDYYLAERRRDDKRFVETVSLSLEASPWRKPLYRGQSDFEWPQVRTGLDPLHRLAFSFFFFFSAENPTKTSTLNQSTLSLSRCSPIYRVINLSARIYLVENICNARASLFNELIAGNGRGDIFF